MQRMKEMAKFWIAGGGAAVTAYLGSWTDDARVLGLAALATAFFTWLVPNAPRGQGVPKQTPSL